MLVEVRSALVELVASILESWASVSCIVWSKFQCRLNSFQGTSADGGDSSSLDDLHVRHDPQEPEYNPKGQCLIKRPSVEHQNRPRFGEEQPHLEVSVPKVVDGVFVKIGATSPGLIAERGSIVLVDCQKFSGNTRFPELVTSTWMQGGDVACLVESWGLGDVMVQVRRQMIGDTTNSFSGRVECFLATSCCMPERHVLWVSWVNMMAGYWPCTPGVLYPEIVMWVSNRRGVPSDDVDIDPYLKFVSEMSPPFAVTDLIRAPLDSFSPLMSNTEYASVSARGPNTYFEAAIVALKSDCTGDKNVMVIFVTLWREVRALKAASIDKYVRALKANTVHRSAYDFERFLFDIKGAVVDVESVADIISMKELIGDYVSIQCYLFFSSPQSTRTHHSTSTWHQPPLQSIHPDHLVAR